MSNQPKIVNFYGNSNKPQSLMGPNRGKSTNFNILLSFTFTIVRLFWIRKHGWVGQSDRNHAEHRQPLTKWCSNLT